MIEYVVQYDNLSADKEESTDCNNGGQNNSGETLSGGVTYTFGTKSSDRTAAGGLTNDKIYCDSNEFIHREKNGADNHDDCPTTRTLRSGDVLAVDTNVDISKRPQVGLNSQDEIYSNDTEDSERINHESATTTMFKDGNQEFYNVQSSTEMHTTMEIEESAKIEDRPAQMLNLRSSACVNETAVNKAKKMFQFPSQTSALDTSKKSILPHLAISGEVLEDNTITNIKAASPDGRRISRSVD